MFDFWSLNPLTLLFMVAGSLGFSYIQRHIGRYLTKSSGIGTQVLVGLCASASVISFLISFSAGLGRLFIYLEALVLLGIELKLLFKHKSLPSLNSLTIALFVFILVTSFSFFSVFRTFTDDGKLIVNAHQVYMSGIPIELLKAEYFSRIRIFDNYPLVFEKFHFLNGSISAILMAPTFNFSYLTFMVSKIVFFLVVIKAGYELLIVASDSRRKAVQIILFSLLSLQLVLPNSVIWATNTNNALPIALMLSGLLAFAANHRRTSLALMLFFSVSTSRSLVPGLAIVFLLLFSNWISVDRLQKLRYLPVREKVKHFKGNLDISLVILICIFLMSFFSLVLTGYSPKPLGRVTLVRTFTEPFNKLFPVDWLGVMSPGSFSLPDVVVQDTYYLSQNHRASFVIFCFIALILGGHRNKVAILNSSVRRVLVTFFFVSCIAVWLVLPDDALLTLFFDYYLIPVLISLLLAPQKLRLPICGFIVLSILQILLLGPDIAFPNWYIIEWLNVSLFSIRLVTVLGRSRYFTLTVAFLLICVQFLSNQGVGELFQQDGRDTTTHIIDVSYIPSINPSLEAWCHTTDDEDIAMAIRGSRIFVNDLRSGRYTVSRGFARESLQQEPLPSIDCRN